MSDPAAGLGPASPRDRRHAARAVLGAAVLALYAAWMAADVVPRWLLLPVVALLAGIVLYRRRSADEQAAYLGYALALLLLLTPVVVVLPDLTAGFAASPATMVLMASNLLLVVVFGLAAALVAYLTYRVDGGPGVLGTIRG